MVNTINFFSNAVKHDRYNLLKYGLTPNTSDIIYTESGNAFNGFDKPYIVDVSYDTIKNCRLCSIVLDEMNNNNPIYCLINDIRILRSNKCMVYLEVDAWLNYRSDFNLGKDNTLFQCTKELNYSYRDFSADYKVIEKVSSINACTKWNIIMMYHDSTNNLDRIYLFQTPKNQFPFYSTEVMTFLNTANLDTNNIMSIYLSPFDIDPTYWVTVSTTTSLNVYYLVYNEFIVRQYDSLDANKFTTSINVVSNFKTKTVITDMNGSIVWQSQRKDNGTKYLNALLDITYDRCGWNFAITDSNNESKQTSPNLRFVVDCVNLAFFLDYYQQYQNLQKSFNADLRQAQLDKQLLDGLGNTIASSVSMGSMSAVGGNVGAGMVGGAIGGLAQTGLSYYATMDYNKKVENIDNRQAKVQYDTITSSNDSFLAFLTGEIEPSIYTLSVDNESIASQTNINNQPYLTYNCRIKETDLNNLLRTTNPDYISGDFEFLFINVKDALQLNTRFKHGVNFVNWT